MTRIDASHHARSLARLAEPSASAPGSFAEALGWLMPMTVPREIDDSSAVLMVDATARFSGQGHWRRDAEFTWVRTVTIDLRVAGEGDDVTSVARIEVPWICDETTQAVAEDLGPGFAVGAFDGLYVGRPMVPIVHNARRPGIWLEHRAAGRQRVVIPNIGPAVRFGWAGRSPAGARESKVLVPLRLDSPKSARLVSYVDTCLLSRAGGPMIMSPGMWELVDATFGGVATLGDPDPDWFSALLTPSDHEDKGQIETSPERREFRLYGDLIRRHLVGALRRAIREWAASSRSPGHLGSFVGRFLQSSLDSFLRTTGTASSILRPHDDRSTLSRLEERRIVTQFGPYGVPDLRAGRPWLRSLHPEFRGQLCPLMGPESEKLGLVRALSLAGGFDDDGKPWVAATPADRLSELSASASLVPFLNHDDPTRGFMGSKNLRQAVPLAEPEPPTIRSGSEGWIADTGVVRSPVDGRVAEIQSDAVMIEADDGRVHRVGFGPALPSITAVAAPWRLAVRAGDDVDAHDLIAAAPDVVIEDGVPVLALGANVMTALMVWRGWNFEDGIAVSRSMSRRFGSKHLLAWRELLAGHDSDGAGEHVESFELSVEPGTRGKAGSVIGWVYRWDEPVREVVLPEDGILAECYVDHGELHVRVEVHRPLEVGDKLTTRHGGKGVVALVEEDADMPVLPDGTRVDMILNPLSIVRRGAVGQFIEIHQGLAQHLSGEGPVTVGRQHGDLRRLFTDLESHGAPGGKVHVHVRGEKVGATDGVVVGPMYMVKLDHLARAKARSRRRGSISPVSQQPAKRVSWLAGRRTGAAQRVGEMEMWAFTAVDALELISDAQDRSDGATGSLESVRAHLRVAGVRSNDEKTEGGWKRSLAYIAPAGLDDFDAEAFDGDRNSVSWVNPLHDGRHGPMTRDAHCMCGRTTGRGTVCAECGTLVRSTPTGERSEFRYTVELLTPVPHPWNLDVQIASIPILPPAHRQQPHDSLDRAYEKLIRFNHSLRQRSAPTDEDIRILGALVTQVLGRTTDGPSTGTIAGRLAGKTGLLRRSLRGRNTDLSARLVLSPDPTIAIDEIGLPEEMLRRLQVDLDASREPVDRVVMLNRPPTLRPSAFVALKARLGEGSTARIHPYLCGLIAGDFDGDEGTIHRPLDRRGREQAWRRLSPSSAVHSAADGALLGSFDHELALGLGRLGRRPDAALGPDPWTLDSMWKLQDAAFAAATGCSLGLVDIVNESSVITEALDAGAIGKREKVEQIRTSAGKAGADFYGVDTQDVPSSYAGGLSDDEYFATAPAALRKLSDKKLVTPLAGGITKMLTEMAYDITIGSEDCGRRDEHALTVLTCAMPPDRLCQRCYGLRLDTGAPPAIGSHVGVLAASMVGERTTQAAMKTHGTNKSVADLVRPLAALFGRGRAESELSAPDDAVVVHDSFDDNFVDETVDDGLEEAAGLGEVAAVQDSAGPAPRRSMRLAVSSALAELDETETDLVALRDRFSAELNVDGRHIEVVWRRLRSSGSVRDAQMTGDPLVDATARGRLDLLFEAAIAGVECVPSSTGRATVIGRLQ